MSSKTDKKVNIELRFILTDTQGVMYDSAQSWHNVPLVGAVYIEQKLLDLLTELQGWGKTMALGQVPDIKI